MLNKHDLVKSLHVSIKEIAYMHAKQILPEPIRLDGVCYWREQDIKLFKRYLRRRSRCRQAGIDPDSCKARPSRCIARSVRSVLIRAWLSRPSKSVSGGNEAGR